MEFTFSTARLLIQTEFAPLVSVLVLIAFIKTNVSFSDSTNRSFLLACGAAILLTASDSMRFISAHMDHPTVYRYISAGVGYALRPLILYRLSVISARYKIKRNRLFTIPLIFCVIISLTNIFPFAHGLMFDFNEANKFVRGPFGFLSHIVCVFYAFQVVYYSLKNFNYNKYEPIIVIIMEIAAFTATLMENRYKYDFVLSQVLISSIIFYYFFLLTQTYKRDTLTHFLNRRCFYLELKHLQKEPLIILSMDLNNLKMFNDTQGHAAGDKAIVTVTTEMFKTFNRYAKLYRTGGDEFMAIFRKSSISEVINLVSVFQKNLEKTEYQVACGYASYTPGDDIEKIISLSDERMYENKVNLKQSKNI